MNFCGKCGNQLEVGSRFCTACGTTRDTNVASNAYQSNIPQRMSPPIHRNPAPMQRAGNVSSDAVTVLMQRGRLPIIVGLLLQLIWLALPFSSATEVFRTARGATSVTVSGYQVIFGHTYTVTQQGWQAMVELPGLWTAALLLLAPILIMLAFLFFAKGKEQGRVLMAVSLFGVHKSLYMFFSVLDANAVLTRMSIGETWNGRVEWHALDAGVDVSVGAGNVLFALTWIAIFVYCYLNHKKVQDT